MEKKQTAKPSSQHDATHIGVMRIIKTKYMNEEEIRDEARKAANRSQFMSNHIYDHKSYEDGFYEGMNQALRQYDVMQRSEQLPCEHRSYRAGHSPFVPSICNDCGEEL